MIFDLINNFIISQNNYKLFTQTLNFSIGVQIITGLIEFFTLFIKVKPNVVFLRDLLVIEFIVQLIELIFYVWLFTNLGNVANITSKRYADWIITTPTMLFTLVMYLIYTNEENKEKLNLYQAFNENKNNIFIIVFLNLLMLIFGYLGETQQFSNIQSKFLNLTFGFVPFLIYFWLIYDQYAKFSDFGKKLFYYFFIVWTFYGVVAYLPYYLRNSCYNILDLFAKNFFGIYLSYIIIQKSFL